MKSLKEISLICAKIRKDSGFFTPSNLDEELNRDSMLGKLMLVVSEVSEAAEAVRRNDQENFKVELADIIIRILDITGTLGIDIYPYILKKIEKNKIREFRHSKKTSL